MDNLTDHVTAYRLAPRVTKQRSFRHNTILAPVAAEMEQLFDIADSTDWLNTSLPAFAPLETALRCQVCKDFYDTPMITSCSHTFCSLCIRKCLSSDGKCPACRASDQASKLRRNWTVQEIVDAFQTARPTALQLAWRESTLAQAKDAKRRGLKRKLEDTDLEEDGVAARKAIRVTRSQSRRAATTSSAAAEAQEVVFSSQEDQGADQEPDDGLVGCPICGTRMKEEAVYTHLDRCDGRKKQGNGRSTRARSFLPTPTPTPLQHPPPQHSDKEPERLPQLNYSLLKEAALRKKLQELGIPTWGPRQLLARRHTEWVNLFNANCDSARPRTKRELLRDLDIWERSQGGHAPNANGPSNGQNEVMRKDFDGHGWAENNRDQFAELIAKAKRKGASSAPSKEHNDPASGPSTTTEPARPDGAPTSSSPASRSPSSSSRPYEGNDAALSIIRAKVEAANQDDPSLPLRKPPSSDTEARPIPSVFSNGGHPTADLASRRKPSPRDHPDAASQSQPGAAARDAGGDAAREKPCALPEHVSMHMASPEVTVKRMPMFQVPEAPVSDVEDGSAVG